MLPGNLVYFKLTLILLFQTTDFGQSVPCNKPGLLLAQSIYFIFTDFQTELLPHNWEICKILGLTQTNTLNPSISILIPWEISEIQLKAT